MGADGNLPAVQGDGPGAVLVVLDHAVQGHVKAHFVQDGLHRRHVALAAVQQNQIRQAAKALLLALALAGLVLLEPAADDLPHGGVVVLAHDGFDFEFPVGGL